jgi:hypothetical protein
MYVKGVLKVERVSEREVLVLLVTQFVAQAYYDWIVRFKNASNLCPT